MNIRKYALALLFGIGTAALYLHQQDFPAADTAERLRILCDGFTVPGVLLTMAGALIWLQNAGALLGVRYGLHRLTRALLPFLRPERRESYGDFTAAKRRRIKGYGFLFAVGGGMLGASLVFLALYLWAAN